MYTNNSIKICVGTTDRVARSRLIHYLEISTLSIQFSSVTQSCPTLQPRESQHARPPCPSQTPGVYSNLCPLSRWCHPAISSSVVPFSCPQSLPASGSFPATISNGQIQERHSWTEQRRQSAGLYNRRLQTTSSNKGRNHILLKFVWNIHQDMPHSGQWNTLEHI